jgi:hypothetical protein
MTPDEPALISGLVDVAIDMLERGMSVTFMTHSEMTRSYAIQDLAAKYKSARTSRAEQYVARVSEGVYVTFLLGVLSGCAAEHTAGLVVAQPQKMVPQAVAEALAIATEINGEGPYIMMMGCK